MRLSGDSAQLAAEAWLKEWLVSGEPVVAIRRFLLAPTAHAPAGFVAAGKVVCGCFGVTQTQIETALEGVDGPVHECVRALQAGLGCGTNCGSCLPELRRLAEVPVPA